MNLGEKISVLRDLEGRRRGLDRGLTKSEVVKLIHAETGKRISLPYLSQLERGTRAHMTNTSRLLLARFFRVHPGFLVDDPEDFHEHLATPLTEREHALASWLRFGAARFRHDRVAAEAFSRLAAHPERDKVLRLLRHVLAVPGLVDRLLHTLETKRTTRTR
ncbi:MAG: transcriptional regulator [Candidatus Rokuibacteriota bacterium]|nr:MAG: transcriptional regulator [Candidatus Rokubacteria bacterium]